ncbi:MAG: hypothetical protein MAG431_02469 [Chloroflexi bacterium]|nr:hypothetical protein [Chloroflexota bacterium]
MKKHLRLQINIQSLLSNIQHLTPIFLAPLILFAPTLFTGKALFWGTPSLQFIPWWDYALDTLRAGHFPFWNPLVGMGAPLMANYQSALFYPPNWIYLLLGLVGGTSLMAWGMVLMVSLHLIWAGLGMAALSRRLGLGTLAQTISGLAFSLSGYLVARAGFLSINATVAWLPWILLFALDVVVGKKLKVSDPKTFRVLKLGLVIGLQLLAGHAQTTWYTLLLAGTWVGFWAWVLGDTKGAFSRMRNMLLGWARYAGAVLIGVGLAAVQLLPTFEYLLQSQRSAAVDYEYAMTYSFWPWRFLTLLAPNLFGNPAHGTYWGYANFWEDAVYIGLLPLLLAFTALSALRKRFNLQPPTSNIQSPTSNIQPPTSNIQPPTSNIQPPTSNIQYLSLTVYCLLITVFSFTLALGKNTPIFPWLYAHVPTFAIFQAPTRFTLWAVFALALLAGLGVERWRRPEKRALYWTRLGTAGAFAVSLGAGLAWYFLADVRLTLISASAMAGLWALGAGVLALTAPPRGEKTQHPVWYWGVVLWVAADLLVAGWGLNPSIDQNFYQEAENEPGGRIYLPPQDEYDLKFERFLRFEDFSPPVDWAAMRAVHLPNLNMLDNQPMVNNFDPFVPGRYQRWMEALGEVEPAPWAEMLNLMGVTTIEQLSAAGDLGVRFTPWVGGPGGTGTEPGLARWVGCADYFEDGERALEAIAGGEVNLQARVTLEGQRSVESPACSPGVGVAHFSARPSPNRAILHVEADQPGWVVWSEVWYPGWRAWVDGKAVSVERGDYLFQAVPVPGGKHEVIFVYFPRWFYVGGCVSLATLGTLLFFLRKKNQYMVTAVP